MHESLMEEVMFFALFSEPFSKIFSWCQFHKNWSKKILWLWSYWLFCYLSKALTFSLWRLNEHTVTLKAYSMEIHRNLNRCVHLHQPAATARITTFQLELPIVNHSSTTAMHLMTKERYCAPFSLSLVRYYNFAYDDDGDCDDVNDQWWWFCW